MFQHHLSLQVKREWVVELSLLPTESVPFLISASLSVLPHARLRAEGISEMATAWSSLDFCMKRLHMSFFFF